MSTISADSVIIYIQHKLEGLPPTPSKPCIRRIDGRYRRVGSDNIYDPEILSIGPYHHGNPRLQNMEQFKYMYLKRLLKRRNEQRVDRYVNAVAAMEKQARQCYADPINLDENQFVTLLVLDGIFIIEFLRCFNFENLRDADDSIFSREGVLTQLFHDIFLLENQLPFFVLNQLFNMTKTNGNLIELAFGFFLMYRYTRIPESRFWDVQKIDHLCGLIRDGWCLPFAETISPPTNGYNFGDNWDNINSASRLRQAGIKFQAVKLCAMNNSMDIKFVKGVLIVPQLLIYDQTESHLRNLILHEQYLPPQKRKCVSDYSYFIFCLIKTSDDVDLLRSHGIISNVLGHDEEVCQMFNRLVRNVTISVDFSYSQVFYSVNSHCRHRRKRWMANLRKNYFSSPWSIISFLAAVVLLILTLTQTVYTLLAYYYR